MCVAEIIDKIKTLYCISAVERIILDLSLSPDETNDLLHMCSNLSEFVHKKCFVRLAHHEDVYFDVSIEIGRIKIYVTKENEQPEPAAEPEVEAVETT